jgi:hypothetical protein
LEYLVTQAVPRPNDDEFAPFYADYMPRVSSDENSIQELAIQRDRVCQLLAPVSEVQASFRYAPDKWSVKQVVGHVGDTERVFAYRLLRIARADETPLPGFDEKSYVQVARFDERPLAGLVADWVAVRNATLVLVRGLGPTAWERKGLANGYPVSVRALFYIILGHVNHHCQILQERDGLVA